METMQQFFGEYFSWVLGLIALVIALTIFVFRRQLFERRYRTSDASKQST